MNKQLAVVFSMAILLSVTVVASVDLLQTADAAKAKGTTTQKYGLATKSKVCGDKLCSDIPPEERQNMRQKITLKTDSLSQTNLNDIMSRMDKVHEKHQIQMMKMWQTMTLQEQSQMIQKMSQMVEKMETMNMTQHMSMMGDMMSDKQHMQHDGQKMMMDKESVYNETLNPRQIDYPNVLGFNDLHIHAIRHLDVEKSHGPADHLLQTIVHHHCKVYDDMTAACLLFPYGMTDQDKPYGIEYVITTDQYQELPDEEKQYWHYHKTEFPRAKATFPELTDTELVKIRPVLDETYGKVYYFWSYGDTYPMGEPYILVVQDIPDQ